MHQILKEMFHSQIN